MNAEADGDAGVSKASATQIHKVEGKADSLQDESATAAATASTSNPKAPPLQKPSYYIESFHEHFFPHADLNLDEDENAEGLPTHKKKLNIFQRYATSMARKSWMHLSIAFVIAVVLSFVGLRFGDFKVAIDNAGWWSRGTLIANRATQETMVNLHRNDLFYDSTGEVWEELTTVVQPNWQRRAREEESEEEGTEVVTNETLAKVCSGQWYGSRDMVSGRENNLVAMWKTDDAESKEPEQNILEADAMYDLCIAEEKTLSALLSDDSCYKCPVLEGGESTAEKCMEPFSLVLLARLYLAGNDMSQLSTLSESISCDSLRTSWNPTVQKQFTSALKVCVNWSVRMASGDATNNITIQDTTIFVSNPCPFPLMFLPTVVDELFPTSDPPLVRYSSSYFATKKSNSDVEVMYDASENGEFGRSDGDPLAGVYDTTDQSFYDYYSDAIVGRDMALAVGSAGVTVIAMMIHTKSPWLTICGLFQIILSFPLAYFVYYFVFGLVFFPFLNFIGIFVVFALGADDVFVAVDKWKNARHELPHGTTEQVAALALPDAAYAMLLTSTTTAVAFFGTAICPVGPIVCFAVFCGLLITFDCLMNILLVFPALCIYDKWLLAGSKNCCVNFDWCCRRKEEGTHAEDDTKDLPGSPETSSANNDHDGAIDVEEPMPVVDSARVYTSDVGDTVGESAKTFAREGEEEAGKVLDPNAAEREELIKVEHKSFIHRILDGYYNLLHKFRWGVLVIVVAAFIACVVFAAQLSLPQSSEVSLLPAGNQYQMHWEWAQNLLSYQIAKDEGTEAVILWGVKPADTGDHLNPDSWTTLVLDDSFDVKSAESQQYLLDFCDRMFAEFGKVDENYECPMNEFNQWLKEQSALENPTDAYSQSCSGASAAPVPPDVFDPCMISWAKQTNTTRVLSTDGSVKIMEVRAKSDVAYDAPFNELKDEWTSYETWLDAERSTAPSGVNQMYHSDISFWWFDTNQQMLKTAYGAAGIALVCAAVIIFISSRSFVLTLFAAISIAYVLVAATACLVGLGWELGFLESILFAILIGISCDFVLHFGHAYAMYSGNVNRNHRSHFSLTHMGPSILAAAFTTFSAAVVMIFTEITFFRKFAVLLFMTIVHSTIGCFVVFLVLCDCFGPAEPTKGYETIKAKLCGKKKE